jgi:hypothetical protein
VTPPLHWPMSDVTLVLAVHQQQPHLGCILRRGRDACTSSFQALFAGWSSEGGQREKHAGRTERGLASRCRSAYWVSRVIMTMTILMMLGLTTHTLAPARCSAVHLSSLCLFTRLHLFTSASLRVTHLHHSFQVRTTHSSLHLALVQAQVGGAASGAVLPRLTVHSFEDWVCSAGVVSSSYWPV